MEEATEKVAEAVAEKVEEVKQEEKPECPVCKVFCSMFDDPEYCKEKLKKYAAGELSKEEAMADLKERFTDEKVKEAVMLVKERLSKGGV